jgi:hypothetical protein
MEIEVMAKTVKSGSRKLAKIALFTFRLKEA